MDLPVIRLTKGQAEFVTDTTTRYLGFLGGYGAGKTFAACQKAIALALQNQGYDGIMCEPTGSLIESVLIPAMIDRLEANGFVEGKTYDLYSSAVNPRFILRFPGNKRTTIYLRSAENHRRIVGMSVAWFICDEFDTSDFDICAAAWKNLCARMRKGDVKQGCITTTKEGFKFCYDFFVTQHDKLIKEGKPTERRMIEAHVMDNPEVDDDYINIMRGSMSPKQFEAYVENKFVNFASGAVYYCYDRIANRTPFTLEDADRKTSPLQIGVDFNVGKMAAVVAVQNGDRLYAVDELFGSQDTMALADDILKKFPGRFIQLYVDASGNSEKTNASLTDIGILRFKFGRDNVFSRTKNALVVDRVGAVNSRFLAADGTTRKLFVNDAKCPKLTACLEQQGFDKTGKPDKSNDVDHMPDALGYLVGFKFPIKARTPTATIVMG